jgi:Glycosyl transferases group 1
MISNSLNILFLSINFRGWIYETLFHEQQAINKFLPNANFYGPGYRYSNSRVNDIISEVYGNYTPDAIFCYIDSRRLLNQPLAEEVIEHYKIPPHLAHFPRGLAEVNIPKIGWINDFWHCSADEWEEILIGNNFQAVFSTYAYPFVSEDIFKSFFSAKVRERVKFIPWPRSINPLTIPAEILPKEYDVTLLGAIDPSFYPLRNKINSQLSSRSDLNFLYRQHPGYRFIPNDQELLVSRKYFEVIKKSRIFSSCTGKYQIPFIKLYEVLACGVPLMCDKPTGGEYLYLKDNENYLPITADNFEKRLQALLADKDWQREMSEFAYQTFQHHHTTDIRAREFVQTLAAILEGKEVETWMKLAWEEKGTKKTAESKTTKIGSTSLFKDESQVYLASADRLDITMKNVVALQNREIKEVGVFASVIGGLSGLNYLTVISPKEIVLYDVNEYSLDYASLICELIQLSDSAEDFISRIFSRSVDIFLRENQASALTFENQVYYLKREIEHNLLADTISKLSLAGKATYRRWLEPCITNSLPSGPRNCRRLLPCWPADQRVPVGGGEESGFDHFGQLVPNTNTFFYGLGWLSSELTFKKVKKAIQKARIEYRYHNLNEDPLEDLINLNQDTVLHISNIDDWFPEQTAKTLAQLETLAKAKKNIAVTLSSHNGIRIIQPDPHEFAYQALKPFVRGRVIEVTHKIPWGFHEFERQNLEVREYLNHSCQADTLILHILVGEGIPFKIFNATLQKAYKEQIGCVLVIEHNRDSHDWRGDQYSHFLSPNELSNSIKDVFHKEPELYFIRGEVDSKRNMLCVVR